MARGAFRVGQLLAMALVMAAFGQFSQARAQGTGPAPGDQARQARVVQAIQASLARQHVPGVSLAVIEHYQIVWAEGFGRRTAGGTEPVDPKSVFQAASISKPLTALAVMKWVQQGQLNLDEDVNRRLRSWQLTARVQTRPVTLRDLLSHRGAISVPDFPGYARGAVIPTLAQVLAGAPPATTGPVLIDSQPGVAYRYSGGGYCVIQQLLTDVTGAPFAELMKQQVLDPLAMSRSTFELSLPAALTADVAMGHDHQHRPLAGGYRIYPEQAAAGLWTTPTDLARVVIDVAQSASGQHGKLLSPSAASEMLTEVGDHCGLGFFVHGQGRGRSFGHSGSNAGYRCSMVGFPATGQGLVIMTNSEHGEGLVHDVTVAVARIYGWP